MNKITKQILSFILVFLVVFLQSENILITSAATNAMVYEYSPMLEDGGDIYYIQTIEGDEYSYDIYRLEVASGNKTKLVSSKNDIINMDIHKETLYYTSYDGEKDIYRTYSVSNDGKDKKTICNGCFVCLDDTSIYYTVTKGKVSKLYKRDYESKKSTLIYKGNMTFRFVKTQTTHCILLNLMKPLQNLHYTF